MENIFMIYKSICKEKGRSVSIILQVTVALLMMLLILGLIEQKLENSDRAEGVIKRNVCGMYWGNKNVILGNSQKLTNDSFVFYSGDISEPDPKLYLKDTYNLLRKDSRIQSVGKIYKTVLYEDSLKYASDNSIKADTKNLVVICNDAVAAGYYNYKTIKGLNFSDYNNKSDIEKNIIPILIGPPLEHKNPIGSIIEIPNCTNTKTSKPLKFRVIGVLNPLYPTVDDFQASTSLENNGYVVIIPKLAMYDDNLKQNYNNLMFQLKNNQDSTKLQKEYLNKLSYCETDIIDVTNRMEDTKNDSNGVSIGGIFYAVIMLTLASFGIISISLSTLLKRKKEIGIRFAIGAKKIEIIVLLIGEYIILFVISSLIALLMAGMISKFANAGDIQILFIDTKVIAITSAVMLLFTAISTLPLVIKILKLSPIEFIKEK